MLYLQQVISQVSLRFELTSKTRILNPTNWQTQEFQLFGIVILSKPMLISYFATYYSTRNAVRMLMKLQITRVLQIDFLLSSSKHKFQTKNSF
jgi:hypothetical protein